MRANAPIRVTPSMLIVLAAWPAHAIADDAGTVLLQGHVDGWGAGVVTVHKVAGVDVSVMFFPTKLSPGILTLFELRPDGTHTSFSFEVADPGWGDGALVDINASPVLTFHDDTSSPSDPPPDGPIGAAFIFDGGLGVRIVDGAPDGTYEVAMVAGGPAEHPFSWDYAVTSFNGTSPVAAWTGASSLLELKDFGGTAHVETFGAARVAAVVGASQQATFESHPLNIVFKVGANVGAPPMLETPTRGTLVCTTHCWDLGEPGTYTVPVPVHVGAGPIGSGLMWLRSDLVFPP